MYIVWIRMWSFLSFCPLESPWVPMSHLIIDRERTETKRDFILWIGSNTMWTFWALQKQVTSNSQVHLLCWIMRHIFKVRFQYMVVRLQRAKHCSSLLPDCFPHRHNKTSYCQQQLMYFSTLILTNMRWTKGPTEVHHGDKKEDKWTSNWDLKMKMKKSYQHCVLSGDNRRLQSTCQLKEKVWFCYTCVNMQSDWFPKPSLKCYALLPALLLFRRSFQPSWRANLNDMPLQEGGD